MASAVATPLERQFGRIAGVTRDDLDELARLDQRRAAVRSRPRHRRGGARRPGGDQRGPRPAAAESPEQPDLSQGQSCRCADHDSGDDVGHRAAGAASTTSRRRSSRRRLSQVEGVGQVNVGGGALPAVRVELNPRALANYDLGFDQVEASSTWPTPTGPRARSRTRPRPSIGATDQLLKAADYEPLIVAYRNGAPVRLADLGTGQDSVQDIRVTGLTNGKPAVQLHGVPPARREHHRHRRSGQGAAAAVPGAAAAAVDLDVAIDRTTTIRASVPTSSGRSVWRSSWSSSSSSSSCGVPGRRSSPASPFRSRCSARSA